MKVGDIVYAETIHSSSATVYWVGVIIRTRDHHGQEQYRVFWNDADETWEDPDTIFTEEAMQQREVENEERRLSKA